MTVELGDRVKDRITGLAGIAVGKTDWLFGCRRITIQPEEAKEGKPAEMFHADEPQLVVVLRGVMAPETVRAAPQPTTGGPRPPAERRLDPPPR